MLGRTLTNRHFFRIKIETPLGLVQDCLIPLVEMWAAIREGDLRPPPTGDVERILGRKEVFKVWWPRLAAQFSEWSANPETFLDAGDAVVVLGHYTGIAKETGS